MNRLLLTGNIVLLGIVVVMSGFLLAPSRNAVHPPAPPFKSCYDCGDATFYGMTIDEFMKGVARYKTTHDNMINKEPYMKNHKLVDARACWFSLDTLEKYICLIRKYSTQLNIPASNLGVRFYYAVYPSRPEDLWDPAYISHHTLFMVPTFNNGKTNVDFDPQVSTQPLASFYNPASTSMPRVMVFDLGGGQLKANNMAKNQGQLCPPNCPPEDLSTLSGVDHSFPNETYQAN